MITTVGSGVDELVVPNRPAHGFVSYSFEATGSATGSEWWVVTAVCTTIRAAGEDYPRKEFIVLHGTGAAAKTRKVASRDRKA